ncbi:MAG: DNA internalization-related competence protein ComEC/Rec2 [Candidatus Omnitrophica bacterium]|nr:DNA internalization-related competence protein ComEC/Rec2 [Candidatus Omnitrophota bacterium]
MRAPLVPVTVAFLLGVLLATGLAPHPAGLALAGVLSAWLVCRGRRRAKTRVLALFALWLCLGALRMAAWQSHPDARLPGLLSDEPKAIQVHGVALSDGAITAAERRRGQRCVLSLRHARLGGHWRPLRGRVLMQLAAGAFPVSYGDDLIVEGTWSRVPSRGNPGQYDWRSALARKRIHGLVRVRSFDGVALLRRGQGNPLLAAVSRWRRRWAALIERRFTPSHAGLLLAALLGARTELDEEVEEAFVATGTIHLLVISGFNVGIIALLLEWLLKLLGVPWRLRLAGAAAGVGGYCLLTGLAPPVARATVMAWVVLGALALDRVISWPNTLAAAALAILWLEPSQLFDPGFQLSFGAVLSLLAFARAWSGGVEQRLGWAHPAWLRRYAAGSLGATCAIWVGLSPVLAWYFHLVSPVSLLANLLVAPLVSALVGLGTPLLLVGAWCEPAIRWSGWALTALLDAAVRVVWWCQRIPGGHWFVAPPSPGWLAGYYGLLGLSLLRRPLGWTHGRLLACWLAGLALWAWSGVALRAAESRWLRVDILDVGHGDSCLVRTPAGHALLIDAGTQEAGRARVVPFLRHAGITALDALVLTHADEDHLGGAIPVLAALPVRRLLTNGVQDDTMSARQVRRLAASRGVPETALAAGMTLGGGPGVRLEVLHPPLGLVPGTAPASNDNSLVVKAARGAVSFLLTGDIEEAGLPWLLRAEDGRLGASVLKVPHHGSRLGRAGEQLFRRVRPAFAVVSVGRAHRLPAPETLEALRGGGAVVVSTQADGAVRLRTDGRRLDVRTFRSRKHWTLGW